jgi:hypothetical protein
MKTIHVLPLIFLAALLTSCSPRLTPFTQGLLEENRWTDSELKQIQFYLSRDIVMYRNLQGTASQIEGGSIKIVNGEKVEEIVIPRGTPGVFLFRPKENRFAVSFEGDSDRKFLMFGPSPKAGDRYVLLASEWDRQRGKVTYNDSMYWVNAEDAFAALMVDLKRSRRVTVDGREARGRRVE